MAWWKLVSEIWLACEDFDIHLLPIWQRRSELMIQCVDILSKENTFWHIHDTFRDLTQQSTGLEVWAPDLSRCGPVVAATIARKTPIIFVLPRREAKSWWNMAVDGCSSWGRAPPNHELFMSNEQGLPSWDFYLFTFNF